MKRTCKRRKAFLGAIIGAVTSIAGSAISAASQRKANEKQIKRENYITVLEQEQMIQYEKKYAGRFDMIASIKEKICLCDIKTTVELDKEYLSWQLSYYEMAMGKEFEKLYAIWLPKKGLGELVEIERKPRELLIKKLNEFLLSYENY